MMFFVDELPNLVDLMLMEEYETNLYLSMHDATRGIAPSVGRRFVPLSNEYPRIQYPCDVHGLLDSLCCDSYI